MKSFRTLSVLVAFVVTTAAFASADTVHLGSFATGSASMGNDNTAMNYAGYQATSTAASSGMGTSYALDPATVWAPAAPLSTWVGSAASAGPVGTSNPAFGFYTFTTDFTVATQQQYYGWLTILADDTAEVLLNGNVLIPFGTLGTDAHCADAAPTCLQPEHIVIPLTSLLSGMDTNTLTFVVEQKGAGPAGGINDPAGVDFRASLTAVPEPGSLIMLGTGLMGSAGMMLRRFRS